MPISVLRCAAMLFALRHALFQAASDPGTIGLGLDTLHMHRTMAARRAYPAFIDRGGKSGNLTLQAYQLEGCDSPTRIFAICASRPTGF
jgi:hypothetical protein